MAIIMEDDHTATNELVDEEPTGADQTSLSIPVQNKCNIIPELVITHQNKCNVTTPELVITHQNKRNVTTPELVITHQKKRGRNEEVSLPTGKETLG